MALSVAIGIHALILRGAAVLKAHEIPSPRLEAETLLCYTLSCQRIDLYTDPDRSCSIPQEGLFMEFVRRRAGHEPIQYITGKVDFSGLSLSVLSGVFIPRPETELLVEAVCSITPSPKCILDLCTGGGALAVALAVRLPSSRLTAIDCSEPALSNARINIQRHQCVDRVRLLKGDLFDAFQPEHGCQDGKSGLDRFDLIVCNPPYIPEEERAGLQPEVRDYEPDKALIAPDRGTAFYRRILQEAPSFLIPGEHLLFELGHDQAKWFDAYLSQETSFRAAYIPDLAGIDRVAVCVLSPSLQGRVS